MTPVRQMKDEPKFDERGWFGRAFDCLTKGAALALAFPPFFLLRESVVWGATETCPQPCDKHKDESQLGTNGREGEQDHSAWWPPEHGSPWISGDLGGKKCLST